MQQGSIIPYRTKDGDTIWRVQYRDASRRQVKETIGRKSEGWTKRKVEAELAERIANVAKRDYKRPDPLAFAECAERWFENGKRLRGWKDSTEAKYGHERDRLVRRFGSRPVHSIKRPELNDYVAELGETLKPRGVNLTLTVLKMIFDLAVKEEMIESNPMAHVDRPRIPDYKPRALTSAEARAVESKIEDPQSRLAFVTFEALGIRWSELRSLRWKSLKPETKENPAQIRIEDSKTPKGERSLYVPKMLLDLFEEHRAQSHYTNPEDFIFHHPDSGSRWNHTAYSFAVKDAAKRAGVGYFRPAHDLRVTNLTEGALAGEGEAVLMYRAGHQSFATTKRYLELAGRVFEDEGERLAARRFGTELRVIEGGRDGGSFVQEAAS